MRSRAAAPEPGGDLAGVVQRNIRALMEARRAGERLQSPGNKAADAVSRFVGSTTFLALQGLTVAGWAVGNLAGWFRFDPFPFVLLSMVVSVEAIFLSTFVLISQNRMTQQADRRAELDLQISLLAEHESTRLVEMVEAIVHHLGIEHRWDDLEELKQDIAPEKVLEAIDEHSEGA